MAKKTYTPEQIINKLREAEIHINQGISISEASRKIGVTQQTYYRWRKEYGGLRIEQAKKLKNLEKENVRLKKQALTSDVFITGTNAVTLDGKIVNMDGHGNRVAAMLFGPEKVILVVGTNKIVENLEAALNRIKSESAPLNVKRHPGFDPAPPCGATGICTDCDSPWRICNKTTIIERQYDNDKYKPVLTLVIVGERLGL